MTLHEPRVRDSIRARLQSLRPDATRLWGSMNPDQMLRHVNNAMENGLGQREAPVEKAPLPTPIMRFLVLNVPWPRNSPTSPAYLARDRYDFEEERAKCLALIDEFASRPEQGGSWPVHPICGQMSGRQWSQLHAKHLDYHLKQFGA